MCRKIMETCSRYHWQGHQLLLFHLLQKGHQLTLPGSTIMINLSLHAWTESNPPQQRVLSRWTTRRTPRQLICSNTIWPWLRSSSGTTSTRWSPSFKTSTIRKDSNNRLDSKTMEINIDKGRFSILCDTTLSCRITRWVWPSSCVKTTQRAIAPLSRSSRTMASSWNCCEKMKRSWVSSPGSTKFPKSSKNSSNNRKVSNTGKTWTAWLSARRSRQGHWSLLFFNWRLSTTRRWAGSSTRGSRNAGTNRCAPSLSCSRMLRCTYALERSWSRYRKRLKLYRIASSMVIVEVRTWSYKRLILHRIIWILLMGSQINRLHEVNFSTIAPITPVNRVVHN